jgi:hypothetical protein
MMRAIDEESPIPDCIICKETELESSKKLLSNILCDCFYNYHQKCMEKWFKGKEKKCILCDKNIDFIMPPTQLELIRIQIVSRRRQQQARTDFIRISMIIVGLLMIFVVGGFIIYLLIKRGSI